MERAIHQTRFEIDEREARPPVSSASRIPASTDGMYSQGSIHQRSCLRIRSRDLALLRLELDDDVPILPCRRTAGCASFGFDLDRHRLFVVRNLRPPNVRVDSELPHQAIDDHLEVKLAHPLDDRLGGFLVRPQADVGSSSASQPSAAPILSWSARVFGSIETEITGSGNVIDSSTTGAAGSESVSR